MSDEDIVYDAPQKSSAISMDKEDSILLENIMLRKELLDVNKLNARLSEQAALRKIDDAQYALQNHLYSKYKIDRELIKLSIDPSSGQIELLDA